MDWWKEFPGWLITTAVAFLALAVVAWQEIRRRLLLPKAHWEGRLVNLPIANGRGEQTFFLRNTGDIDAMDVMVLAYNCSIPGPNPGERIRVAKMTELNRVPLEDVDDSSYLVITWRSPHHRARNLSTWLPAQEGTDLALEHWEQQTWPWYRHWWGARRHRHGVGPGVALQSWLPRSPREVAKLAKKLKVPTPSGKR